MVTNQIDSPNDETNTTPIPQPSVSISPQQQHLKTVESSEVLIKSIEMEDVSSSSKNVNQTRVVPTSSSHMVASSLLENNKNTTLVPIGDGIVDNNQMISKRNKKAYIITTKCGQINVTVERVLSFFIMILTISILLIISFLSTGTIVIRTATEDVCYPHVSGILVNLGRMKTSFDILIERSDTRTKLLKEVNTSMTNVTVGVGNLIRDVPYYSNVGNISRENVNPILRTNLNNFQSVYSNMINNIEMNATKTETTTYYKTYFLTQMTVLVESLNGPLIISDKAAINEDFYMTFSTILNTVLVSITLLIIAPVMVIVLIITIGRDNLSIYKLKKADAYVIIETMENAHSQALFREFCKQHNEYSKYLFLEKVQSYREHCEKIYNIHDEIDTNSDVSGSDSSKNLSYEIDILEGKKFELAFEIITEYLDVQGESFLGMKLLGGKKAIEKVKKTFDTKSINLPDNLFKSIQTSVAVDLLPTYKHFDHHQKKNREDRKQKIKEQFKPSPPLGPTNVAQHIIKLN